MNHSVFLPSIPLGLNMTKNPLICLIFLTCFLTLIVGCGGGESVAPPEQSTSATDDGVSLVTNWELRAKAGAPVTFVSKSMKFSQDVEVEKLNAIKHNAILGPRSSLSTNRYFIGFGSRPMNIPSSFTGHGVVFFIHCTDNICSERITGFNMNSNGNTFTTELTAAIRNIENILYVEMDALTYASANRVADNFQPGSYFILSNDCITYLRDVARAVDLRTPLRVTNLTPDSYVSELNTLNTGINVELGKTIDWSTLASGSSPGQSILGNPRLRLDILSGVVEISTNKTIRGQDPVMYLLNAAGTQIAFDDDAGGNQESRIQTRLGAGTYYIVIGSYNSGGVGRVNVKVSGDILSLESASNSSSILSPISTTVAVSNQSPQALEVSGRWDNSPTRTSTIRADQQIYTFTMTQAGPVTINLIAGSTADTDPYLYLLNASDGSLVEENDDIPGSYNSQIIRILQPGNYYLIAATYRAGSSGAFRLNISGLVANLQIPTLLLPAISSTTGNSTSVVPIPSTTPPIVRSAYASSINGNWTGNSSRSALISGNPNFDVFVSVASRVQIDVVSSTDPVAYLFSGDLRQQLAYNDDASPTTTNSQISVFLQPGLYQIFIGTYRESQVGTFIVTVSGAGIGGGLRAR